MLAENTQRLIDDYLGAIGSAAIVSRGGDVLFCSEPDDSARGLVAAFERVVDDEPDVVSLPASRARWHYGVALDARHALFVVAARSVAPGVIATRMKNVARLLRRALDSAAPKLEVR